VTPTLELPTVHLNGTGRTQLADGYLNAYRQTRQALDAFAAIEFHARDYYVNSRNSYTLARDARDEHAMHLRALMDYLEAHLQHLGEPICGTWESNRCCPPGAGPGKQSHCIIPSNEYRLKIVINNCYGGYCLSEAAYNELGIPWDTYGFCELDRSDPKLVSCVEKLGSAASGSYAKLKIVEVPDDVEWEIHDYDGLEWVAEKHRIWD
jgi:hypothetical protein